MRPSDGQTVLQFGSGRVCPCPPISAGGRTQVKTAFLLRTARVVELILRPAWAAAQRGVSLVYAVGAAGEHQKLTPGRKQPPSFLASERVRWRGNGSPGAAWRAQEQAGVRGEYTLSRLRRTKGLALRGRARTTPQSVVPW